MIVVFSDENSELLAFVAAGKTRWKEGPSGHSALHSAPDCFPICVPLRCLVSTKNLPGGSSRSVQVHAGFEL